MANGIRVSRKHRAGRRAATAIASIFAVLVVSGCMPAHTVTGPFRIGTITPDPDHPGDKYHVQGHQRAFTASASRSNKGINSRIAVLPTGVTASANHQSCVTWDEPTASDTRQPGVVLRANISDAGTDSIMVTNNIWFGARQGVNVHITHARADGRYTQIAGKTLPSLGNDIFTLRPRPWRFCARVDGRVVQVKAWSTKELTTEPAWGDPAYGYSATLPTSAPRSGTPGYYVGHLKPGTSMTLTDLQVGR